MNADHRVYDSLGTIEWEISGHSLKHCGDFFWNFTGDMWDM